jgi:hypothetical protein
VPDFGRLAVRGRRFPGAPAGPLAAPPFPLTIKPHLLPCLCSSIELVAKYLRLHITVLLGRELMPVISPRGACCAVLCCAACAVPYLPLPVPFTITLLDDDSDSDQRGLLLLPGCRSGG